jgi:hypothetical protein
MIGAILTALVCASPLLAIVVICAVDFIRGLRG